MVRFRRSGASLFGRELSLSGRGARHAAPLVSGRVVSCVQSDCISAGQACHSSVGGKYSSKVTTRPVVTPDYTVTTRFPGAKSENNRSSGAVLTTRIGGLCPLSGNKTRDKTVFHTPPRNTTKPQVKSGAFEKSAHHFSTLENAPFQIICSGICSAPGLPKGDSCTRGLCASSRQDDVAVLVVQRHLAPNTLPLSVE